MVLNPCVFYVFYQNIRVLKTRSKDFMDSVFPNNFKVYCITKTRVNDTALSHNLLSDLCYVSLVDIGRSTSNVKRGSGMQVAVCKSFSRS